MEAGAVDTAVIKWDVIDAELRVQLTEVIKRLGLGRTQVVGPLRDVWIINHLCAFSLEPWNGLFGGQLLDCSAQRNILVTLEDGHIRVV